MSSWTSVSASCPKCKGPVDFTVRACCSSGEYDIKKSLPASAAHALHSATGKCQDCNALCRVSIPGCPSRIRLEVRLYIAADRRLKKVGDWLIRKRYSPGWMCVRSTDVTLARRRIIAPSGKKFYHLCGHWGIG